ncbi:MAG: MFS transporter [Polyangiales bacterium]
MNLGVAVYWFVMTAALGVYFPYFSLYLRDALGFSGAQIGVAYAVAPLMGMLAQPLWGQVADRTGSRTRVLALLSAGTATGYGLLTLPHSFPGVICATAFLSFFSTAQVPMAIAVSLAAIERDGRRITLGRVRVWGTIGFLITVVGVPHLLEQLAASSHASERETFHLMFGLAATLAAIASLIAARLPHAPAHARMRASPEDLRWLRGHVPYLRVLAMSFLAYVCLQGPMVLFPVYIHARGGNATTISEMWMFMLATEIVLMLTAAKLYARLGAQWFIAIGVIGCGIRWLLCGLCDELTWVYPLQMMHGLMVVSLQLGSALLVEQLVPDRLRASSQAGLNLFGSSLGGIISATLAGNILDAHGINTVMILGGISGITLGLLIPKILPDPPQPIITRATPSERSDHVAAASDNPHSR